MPEFNYIILINLPYKKKKENFVFIKGGFCNG